MEALVLEKVKEIKVRDIKLPDELGSHDVRVAMHTVGICGSDVHYYQHGAIGPFVVRQPMVLGHEGSGTVVEVGNEVKSLKVGDRVCMEPGIPDPNSKATRLGIYNLDPAVRFWATPPVHGCLTGHVVHPEAFTFRLPDNVSFAEGAMVEPLAVGMHAANKAQIRPGDVAVVFGAGPIGQVTTLAALAGGVSRVVICDLIQPKLDLAASLGPVTPVNIKNQKVLDVVNELTDGWGADIVFECSGNEKAAAGVFEPLCPGGRVVYVGMPGQSVPIDIVAMQVKEARVETVFRYAHVYPRALALMGGGKINVRPLITDTFSFKDSVQAFNYACNTKPGSIKTQIKIT